MAGMRRLIWSCFAVFLLGAGQIASNPWFGTWKLRLKDPKEMPETLIYSDAGQGAMRMVSVEAGSDLITNFDGKPSFDRKSGPAPSTYLAVKRVSRTSYNWTFARPGKADVQGRNTLAADGKSFTEVSWLVTKPRDTITLIYDRQR